MTTKARSGVGATFEIDTGGGYAFIAELLNIGGPELAVEDVEATSLDSVGGYKEYVPGAIDGGNCTVTLNFKNDAQQRALRALVGTIQVADFRITMPTSPLNVVYFSGSLSSWSQSTEANAVLTADVSIKISGEVTYEAPAPAYAYDSVAFDGTAWLSKAANLTGIGDSRYFTVAAKFNAGTLANETLIAAGGTGTCSFRLSLNAAGGLIMTFLDSTSVYGNSAFQFFNDGTLVANTDYVVHIAIDTVGGVSYGWINGEIEVYGTGGFSDLNFPTAFPFVTEAPTMWRIAANAATTAGAKFNGRIHFLWFDCGNVSKFVTDPAEFYDAAGDVDLGANGNGPTGSQPLIFFGGVQATAGWQAGTNLGSGGGFTVTGTIAP